MKWPNMVFSAADRIVSILHVRGLIDHKPKSFSFHDIAPKGYYRICNLMVDCSLHLLFLLSENHCLSDSVEELFEKFSSEATNIESDTVTEIN